MKVANYFIICMDFIKVKAFPSVIETVFCLHKNNSNFSQNFLSDRGHSLSIGQCEIEYSCMPQICTKYSKCLCHMSVALPPSVPDWIIVPVSG